MCTGIDRSYILISRVEEFVVIFLRGISTMLNFAAQNRLRIILH